MRACMHRHATPICSRAEHADTQGWDWPCRAVPQQPQSLAMLTHTHASALTWPCLSIHGSCTLFLTTTRSFTVGKAPVRCLRRPA